MGERTLFAAVLLACISAPVVRTQPPPGTAGARLEGDWVRIDPDGVGSFDGLSGVVPAAQLVPGVTGGGRGGRGGRGAQNQPGRIRKAFLTSWLRSRAAVVGAVAETEACSSTRTRVACTSSSRRTR